MAFSKVAGWLRKLAQWISPAADLAFQIEALLADPAYQPVLRALRKTNSDRAIGAADADTKLKETLLWAEYYSNKKVARSDAWKTRFLVELLVGIEKGFLKR